jgi:drug/metabolite transporter (DMT)-like permease
MALTDLLRLLVLASIWGGSFLFMRVAAPVLGPAYLVEGRSFFAAIFLLILAFYLKKSTRLLKDWKHYAFMGFFNSALPFLLFAQASLHLSTSQLSTLNATGPIWGYLIGVVLKIETLSLNRGIGLVLGFAGVGLLFGQVDTKLDDGVWIAVALGLSAACCYGLASNYAKKSKSIDPFDNAHGSMWASAFLLLPTLYFFPLQSEPTPSVWTSVLALGVVCSGIAYLLYFRLIENIGAASALSVAFLIPLFGTLWGVIFMGEELTWHVVFGMTVILLGTALVTQFNPVKLLKVSKSDSN